MRVFRQIQALGRDERGVAAVELALVLPFMLLLLLGSVEMVQFLETQRRVSHVAYAIGDLVAQEREVNSTDLDNVFIGGKLLMDPLPSATLGQRIASYRANAQGVLAATPDWTRSSSPAYAGTRPLSPPTGGAPANQSVVVVDVSYTYTPALRWVLPSTIKFEKRAVLRPRTTDYVRMK